MSVERIEDAGKQIQGLHFKSPGVFANSLLKNVVATHIIRDIEPKEVLLVKGKTVADVDTEALENSAILESLISPSGSQSEGFESKRLQMLNIRNGVWWKLSKLLGRDLKIFDSPPPGYPQDDDPKELLRCIDELEDRIKILSDITQPEERTLGHINRQLVKAYQLQKDICHLEGVVKSDRAELRRFTISE